MCTGVCRTSRLPGFGVKPRGLSWPVPACAVWHGDPVSHVAAEDTPVLAELPGQCGAKTQFKPKNPEGHTLTFWGAHVLKGSGLDAQG